MKILNRPDNVKLPENIGQDNVKEVVLKYTKQVADSCKTSNNSQTIQNICKYLMKDLNYDNERLSKYRADNTTTPLNLYDIAKNKHGICRQMSEIFDLICRQCNLYPIMVLFEYENLKNKGNGYHYMNAFSASHGELLFVDISSMVHCEKDGLKDSPANYYLVDVEKIIFNFNKRNFNIKPIYASEQNTLSASDMYDSINENKTLWNEFSLQALR